MGRKGGVIRGDRDVYDPHFVVTGFPPALGGPVGRQILLDAEDHFTRKLFSHGFEKGFLVR